MSDKCWRVDLREIHDVLVTVAKEAGTMITAAKPAVGEIGSKKNCKSLLSAMVSRQLVPNVAP